MYPKSLPIFFTSDHGTNLHGTVAHDIQEGSSSSRFHFTWNPQVVETHKKWRHPRVLGIRHPWYLLPSKVSRLKQSTGTLFFPVHTNPGFTIEGLNDEESITYLKMLPEKYHPVSICLHQHDLNSQREKKFVSEGFEIVTAGDGRDEKYEQKFRDLILGFKFGISESWGSQVAYMITLGIPCQIIKRSYTVIENVPNAKIHGEGNEILAKNLMKLEEAFNGLPHEITPVQRALVNEVLGLDFKNSRLKVASVAWFSFLLIGIPWLSKRALKKLPLVIHFISHRGGERRK